MPWQPRQSLLRSLGMVFGLISTVWISRKLGALLEKLMDLGRLAKSVVLRNGRDTRSAGKLQEHGHWLEEVHYPGRKPSPEAMTRSRELLHKAMAEQDIKLVIEYLAEAALLNPPDAEIHLARSKAYHQAGDILEALDEAEMCVSLDEKHLEGWLRRGRIEESLSRFGDAVESYKAGLKACDEASGQDVAALRRELAELAEQAESRKGKPPDFSKLLAWKLGRFCSGLEPSSHELHSALCIDTAHVADESSPLREPYKNMVSALAKHIETQPRASLARCLRSELVVDGLCMALRIGWHVHHGVPKLAANALVALANCEGAPTSLRRRAARGLFAGLLRWLLDARPEADLDSVEEVSGCNCSTPRRAAACFLERLVGPGGGSPLVREESEKYPDIAQLCLWLTVTVRDHHAAPVALVTLLQAPGVAAACMRSQAVIDFYLPLHDLEGFEALNDLGDSDVTEELEKFIMDHVLQSSANAPGQSVGQAPPVALELLMGHGRSSMTVINGQFAASMGTVLGGGSSSSTGAAPTAAAGTQTDFDAPRQRLGEWLMTSLGYLCLFVGEDALITISVCRSLHSMVQADPEGKGVRRFLGGVWLGLPLLQKLSITATRFTAALDLLQYLFRDPDAQGLRVAARSLARSLARAQPAPQPPPSDPVDDPVPAMPQQTVLRFRDPTGGPNADVSSEVVAPLPAELQQRLLSMVRHFHPEDDIVPTWLEYYQEILHELSIGATDIQPDGSPEIVTLLNFEEKTPLFMEHISIRTDQPTENGGADAAGVLAVWNRAVVREGQADMMADDAVAMAAAGATSAAGSSGSGGGSRSRTYLRLQIYTTPRAGSPGEEVQVGSEAYVKDPAKQGTLVLMSRRAIRRSSHVSNWAQAVTAAQRAGAAAVVIYNDLDGAEPFRMGLFGERAPSIQAFMVSGVEGANLVRAAEAGYTSITISTQEPTPQPGKSNAEEDAVPLWPSVLSGTDIAQAWSLLEALSNDDESVKRELDSLMARMGPPEKRVCLTRRLVRHHRARQAPSGDIVEPVLAFVEGDRSLSGCGQLKHLREQVNNETGIGAEDISGEFEVRFKGEQGVGSALMREYMDIVCRRTYLHPRMRLLKSYDNRQTFWPHPVAVFVNPHWQTDFEVLGRLIGLALFHSVTLDLPLHPHVCSLLFGYNENQIKTTLEQVDPDLYKFKVKWLLENPVADVGVDVPFADVIVTEEELSQIQEAIEEEKKTAKDAEERGEAKSAEDWEAEYPGPREALEAEGVSWIPGVLPTKLTPEHRLPGTVSPSRNLALRMLDSKLPTQLSLADEGAPGADVVMSTGEEDDIVTDDNKEDFVRRLQRWRLYGSIEPQIAAMKRGLHMVLPEVVLEELRALLSAEEMASLVSGLNDIDVDDWELHAAYGSKLRSDSPRVKWFWKILREWSASQSREETELLPRLLEFVTGSSRVPIGGFSELVGAAGAKHPFMLAHGEHLTPMSLPTVHACICTMDLPPYADEDTMREKLKVMLKLGRANFDEGAGQAPEEPAARAGGE
eukprot:TRINITY_DN8078_c0_g1_i9.p1 TRINITY_DN8078_c0_g1~~TRINITY_DN8078_c0_g1_i9.p1  ORF type:complete len:1522 (+),score=411.65 TRINITY_DN8078_c0_g1_i9:174-4739(+)